MKKKRQVRKAKAPPQVTLGGEIGRLVWRRYVLPLIRDTDKSTREIAAMLGVSHQTVHRWRTVYAY